MKLCLKMSVSIFVKQAANALLNALQRSMIGFFSHREWSDEPYEKETEVMSLGGGGAE